jgi:hypothetical protein
MPSLDDHCNALTKVRPPEGWPDLGERGTRPLAPPPGRRRRVGVAALALLIAAAGLVFAIRAFPGERAGTPAASALPAGETPGPSPTATASTTTPSPAPQSGMFAAMLDAIRASSPPGWTFALNSDRLDGDWRLDGDADDGSGPGRLSVDVTVRPGMLEAHPCADQEFRQGARCEERPLSNGDLLVLRDIVMDAGGMKTIEVVLIHPDRSGVGAEAGNWTIAALAGGTPISQSDLPTPQVTRADPLYTVDQLAQLVLAVDEGTRECIRTGCN